MFTIQNPIVSGFSPDPSVCRAGKDYYLVNSSFTYFPGIPIYRSRDLGHWELIGNVLQRPSQLSIRACAFNDGIYAPTIRFHNGVFYVICTNVKCGGNFIVTAEHAEGPWSDPYWLGEDAAGFDPSLFFDEDGSCWYIGTRENSGGSRYNGDNEIWLRRVDLTNMRLTGQTYILWNGAMRDVPWPEGPHLYRNDGFYYLMIAEGGTAENHCVTIARSEMLTGPYTSCPNNPILTHRHLGKTFPVVNVGHGDLTQAPDGSWCMVVLGSRPENGFCNLGRETFLARVAWEDGWPVVNPGIGRLEQTVSLPWEASAAPHRPERWDFGSLKRLPPDFLSLHGNPEGFCSLTQHPGFLRLWGTPGYLCVRQRSHAFTAEAAFLPPSSGTEAGLAIVQNDNFSLHITVRGDKCQLFLCRGGIETVRGTVSSAPKEQVSLKIVCRGQIADFSCGGAPVARDVDMSFLSTESAGGFVGCTFGIWQNGNKGTDFSRFSMETGA